MNSLLDDVNALLKLKQGDLGRLEHIKKTLEAKQVLYISDSKYLKELTREYLKPDTDKIFKKSNPYDYPEYTNRMKNTESSENQNPSSSNDETQVENIDDTQAEEAEHIENVFCWKCGTKNPEFAEFCNYCGSLIRNVQTKSENKSVKEIPKIKKKKGKKISKKILIGLGVLVVIFIIGGIGGSSSTDTSSQIITVGESKTLGNVLVDIDKIEFHGKYAKIFLSVENLGSDEAYLYETDTYVIQEKTQFKTKIPKPLGASGNWIDGYDMPPKTIREGIIFVEVWNPDEPYELVLEGSYIRQDAFGGLIKDMQFVFDFEPKESVSKCGAGTVFDEETNSCIVG